MIVALLLLLRELARWLLFASASPRASHNWKYPWGRSSELSVSWCGVALMLRECWLALISLKLSSFSAAVSLLLSVVELVQPDAAFSRGYDSWRTIPFGRVWAPGRGLLFFLLLSCFQWQEISQARRCWPLAFTAALGPAKHTSLIKGRREAGISNLLMGFVCGDRSGGRDTVSNLFLIVLISFFLPLLLSVSLSPLPLFPCLLAWMDVLTPHPLFAVGCQSP